MKHVESNLQLMLRYKTSKVQFTKRKKLGVSLDWFTSKQHQGFMGSKVWGHICKA